MNPLNQAIEIIAVAYEHTRQLKEAYASTTEEVVWNALNTIAPTFNIPMETQVEAFEMFLEARP